MRQQQLSRKKKSNQKTLFAINKKPWKALLAVVVGVGLLGSIVYWVQSRAAGTATISLTPGSSSVVVNDSAVFEVHMDSTVGITSADVYITYPADKLEFVSIDQTESGFGAGQPAARTGDGVISITQFSLAPVSGSKLLAKVTFKAVSSNGVADVLLRDDTALWSVDPTKPEEANNEVGTRTNAAVTLTGPPDTTPPTNVVITADPETVTAGTGVTLSATAQDDVAVTRIEFYEGTVKLGEDSASPFTFVYKTDGKEGLHVFTATAYDAAGNSSTKGGGVSVTVNPVGGADDTQPPTNVTLSSSSGSVTVGQSVTLTSTAEDNVGVARIDFVETDGGILGSDGSDPYNFVFTPTSAGNYEFTARAYDAAGNSAASSAVTLTAEGAADTVPPTISLSATPTTVTAGSVIDLTATANDNVGVTEVKFYDGSTLLTTDTTSPYTYALATTGLASGVRTLSARAYDAAGNSATSDLLTVTINNPTPTVDTAAPSVPTSLSTNAVSHQAVSLVWSPSTDNIGVTGYKVYRNGAEIVSTAVTSYSDNSVAPSTSYTYTVAAFDAAGNVSAQSAARAVTTVAAPATSGGGVTTTPASSGSSAVAVNNGTRLSGANRISSDVAASQPTNVDRVDVTVCNGVTSSATSAPFAADVDTTTLPDGTCELEVATFSTDGSVDTQTRTIEVDNDLSAYEQLRNGLLSPWAGASGRTLNAIFAGFSTLVLLLPAGVYFAVKRFKPISF